MFDPRVHVGVAALVVSREYDRQALVLRRSATASHGGGTWALPGGWVEWGETPEEAVLREVREEVGLRGQDGEALLIDAVSNTYDEEGMHVLCLFYVVMVDNPDDYRNLEPEKHDRVGWLPWDELETRELFPALKTFIERKELWTINV